MVRRRTGKRARAMVDVSRWCKTRGCTLLPAHLGECEVRQDQVSNSSAESSGS